MAFSPTAAVVLHCLYSCVCVSARALSLRPQPSACTERDHEPSWGSVSKRPSPRAWVQTVYAYVHVDSIHTHRHIRRNSLVGVCMQIRVHALRVEPSHRYMMNPHAIE